MNFIFKNLKPYKKELILGPTFKLCEAIIEISLPIILSHIINDFSSVVKTNYTFLCLFLLSLVLIAFGSSISCQYMAAKTSQNFGKSIRKNFFEKLSTLSANQLENFSSASLTNRFTNDIGNLELAVALLIRLVIRVPFIFIGSLLMIFLLNKTISIIVLLSTIILGIFVFLIFKYSSPIFEKYNLKLDRMLTRLKENLENVQLVRGFNMQHFENKNFEKNNKLLGKNYFKANFISSLLNPISTIILDITILEILYFTKFNPGNLLIGDLIAIINYISQMLTVIIVFSNLVTTYSKAFSSYNRLNDFFNLNPEFIYGNENTFDNNAIAVKFENVNFSFSKETNLFENLNIAIASGEIIGIVGLTSAGKTTFLNLINRSLDCTSGNIKLFEKSIKDYSFDALKENITYISQKPEFFTNSIKENILLGKEYSPHSFDYALQNSDSKEFIERFTEKENTIIYNNAQNLSGGQKQRISLARAFIKPPKILILDTVTSAFDLKTEANIMNNIYNYSKQNNITTFIASQKTSTLKKCDKILVLDNFKIKGFDTHENLLNSSKLYQSLYKMQERNR